ncbi:hypothetical protein F5Y16DRAFT_18647 [Xylariaceae sp. FL0255]|nr:hypothetical protein F5Y16DRAFT_18647 [Xylariaceae sp. FL0255]
MSDIASAMAAAGSNPAQPLNSSPPSKGSQKSKSASLSPLSSPPESRKWSRFELDAICALICKHEHIPGPFKAAQPKPKDKDQTKNGGRTIHNRWPEGKWPAADAYDLDADGYYRDWALRFTQKLNEALNPNTNNDYEGIEKDIPASDVRDVMDFIETENPNIMAYIRRQPPPFRITRAKRLVFQRMYGGFNDRLKTFCIHKWEKKLAKLEKKGFNMSVLLALSTSLSTLTEIKATTQPTRFRVTPTTMRPFVSSFERLRI